VSMPCFTRKTGRIGSCRNTTTAPSISKDAGTCVQALFCDIGSGAAAARRRRCAASSRPPLVGPGGEDSRLYGSLQHGPWAQYPVRPPPTARGHAPCPLPLPQLTHPTTCTSCPFTPSQRSPPPPQRAGCTSHPMTGQAAHGSPGADAGIAFQVAPLDGGSRLCPGGTFQVTVSLPGAREMMLTTNAGTLSGGDASW
jgi:hypothetical protein